MDSASPNSESTGLLNVGRRSIRRLAHAIKRRRESAAGEASDAPVRAPTENTAASSRRKSNSISKKTPTKCVFPTSTREQEPPTTLLTVQPTATEVKEAVRRGATARRRSSGRKASRPATSNANVKSLVTWPFKRSQGRLDIHGRPLLDRWPSRKRAAKGGKREVRVRTSSIASRTCTKESRGRITRQAEATAASTGQQGSRTSTRGGDEESVQWRLKKRRRRKSQSDVDDYLRRTKKASNQTHTVAAGLATPGRTSMKEKDRRCTPKKLNVKKEEFLSLKKKLEWELTLNTYKRQKKEFMEINKDLYEWDDSNGSK